MAAFLMITPFISQARIGQNNGVTCWNGDLNYPYFDQGNHAGSVVDVSSAYVSENNDEYVEVRAIAWMGQYDVDYLQYQRIELFRYYKASHQIVIRRENDKNFEKPLAVQQPLVNNAFYLIRTHLGI